MRNQLPTVGDKVVYTKNFLERQSRYYHAMDSATGCIKALYHLGTGVILADIEWDKPGLPKRVNTKFLTSAEATVLT